MFKTVIKAFDHPIKLNDIFMTSDNVTTVLKVKENVNDPVIKAFDSVIALNHIFDKSKCYHCTWGQGKYSWATTYDSSI